MYLKLINRVEDAGLREYCLSFFKVSRIRVL